MNSIEQVAVYLIRVVSVTLVQLFTLGGPALVLILLVSLMSGLVQRLAGAVLGQWPYLLLFGWFGTVAHEVGHWIFARAFGHQVVATNLFRPNLKTGELGSVWIRDDGNLLQYMSLFFLGIAPIIFGPLLIFVSLYLLYPSEVSNLLYTITAATESSRSWMRTIFAATFGFFGFLFSPAHLLDWRLYVFLYIAFAVGSSIHLSGADISAARKGCLTFVVLLFLFNLVLLPLGVTSENTFAWLSSYYTFFYVMLIFVMLLDLLAAAILWLPATLARSAHKS